MRISDWGSDVCSSDRLGGPVFEGCPVGMAADIRTHGIIHPRALQRRVGKGEAAGLDDMRGRAETGGGAQHRADVPGDIGLEEGDVHRSEEHTSELQSLMRITYAVF